MRTLSIIMCCVTARLRFPVLCISEGQEEATATPCSSQPGRGQPRRGLWFCLAGFFASVDFFLPVC